MHSSTHAALSRCILVPSDHQTYFEKFRYQLGNSNFRLCRANKQVGISIVAPRPLSCCATSRPLTCCASIASILPLYHLSATSLSPTYLLSPHYAPTLTRTYKPIFYHVFAPAGSCFISCLSCHYALAHTHTHTHTQAHTCTCTQIYTHCVCVCVCVCVGHVRDSEIEMERD